jgi:alkaline phosphatase
MGPGQFGAARLYSTKLLGKELHMAEVMRSGRTAYLANDSADSVITESAAAATQIACGVRALTGAVGMGPDGKTPCKTLLEIAKDRGLATGLVTTSGITDATPAAFAAHVRHRSDEFAVAVQEVGLGVEVLQGGRRQFFLPEAAGGVRMDGKHVIAMAQTAGYTVVGTAGELQRAEGPKLLGLYSTGNMSYEIDRAGTAEPSLSEMTAKAFGILSRNPRGFFAVIEGGRIDHAAHRNDAPATIRDTLAFDEAVGVALEFQTRSPDTLLIVAADHETGGMSLIGHRVDGRGDVGMNLELIRNARASFELMQDALGWNPTPEQIKEVVKQYLAVEITEVEAKAVAADSLHRLDPRSYPYPTLHTLAFVLRPYLGVGWVSGTHTGSPLMAFGSGPGSGGLVGFRHNTDLFRIMKAALGGAH